jgi:hypothetical protein
MQPPIRGRCPALRCVRIGLSRRRGGVCTGEAATGHHRSRNSRDDRQFGLHGALYFPSAASVKLFWSRPAGLMPPQLPDGVAIWASPAGRTCGHRPGPPCCSQPVCPHPVTWRQFRGDRCADPIAMTPQRRSARAYPITGQHRHHQHARTNPRTGFVRARTAPTASGHRRVGCRSSACILTCGDARRYARPLARTVRRSSGQCRSPRPLPPSTPDRHPASPGIQPERKGRRCAHLYAQGG